MPFLAVVIPVIGITVAQAIAIVITIASMAFQMLSKDKRKAPSGPDNANNDRQSRTGLEVVAEGQTGYLQKVYGRAKVGGFRVYHNISSNYKSPAVNTANITFSSGHVAARSGSYTETTIDETGALSRNARTYTVAGSDMSGDITGAKNEFLYFQQMLCIGPISSVRDMMFDGEKFLDNPAFSEEKTDNYEPTSYSAMRFDYMYSGGIPGPIVSRTFGERLNATFDGIAYFDGAIRLNKNDPQFYGVPEVHSFIEGSPVRNVSALGVLSSVYSYDNNPALCLLDYMLDTNVGKGVKLSEIDLVSFKEAADICRIIVQQDVPVAGHIWQPSSDSLTSYATRDLPLYECNYAIDTSKSIRDNITGILDTMGDGRLVYSQGKYKLKLKYAPSEGALASIIDGTIAEDDIALGSTVKIAWPEAKDRLNFCTVRFHNEFEDFKEDSRSWPPKYNSTSLRGIGGAFSQLSTQDFEGSSARSLLLNEYGIWSGNNSSIDTTYKIIIEKEFAGNWTLAAAAGTSITVTIHDQEGVLHTTLNAGAYATTLINLGSTFTDKWYTLRIQATGSTQALRSAAASLTSEGRVIWNTRSVRYSSIEVINQTDTVYQAFLAEDSGMTLEADVFSGGVTDPYHALALAEEYVRVSRSAALVEFEIIIRDKIYEPGDYVFLAPYDLYVRIDEVEATESWTLKYKAARVDSQQFAWSLKPSQVSQPAPIFETRVPAPFDVRFLPNANSSNSMGRLEWAGVNYSNFSNYTIYMHVAGGPTDSAGIPLFEELGSTTNTWFDVPNVDQASAFFGVRTRAQNGRMSAITYTSQTEAIVLRRVIYTFQGLNFQGNSPTANKISWSSFTAKMSGSPALITVPGGNATWTIGTLYLYFDGSTNTVHSTTDYSIAQAFNILAEYVGGPSVVVKGSSLKPPMNIRDLNSGMSPEFRVTWDEDPQNAIISEIIKGYQIVFLDGSNNVLKSFPVNRGEVVGVNQDINVSIHGTLSRTLRVRVYAVNSNDILSLTYTSATLVNPAPAAPSFEINEGFAQVFVRITSAKAIDHSYYKLYWGSTSVFVPNTTDMLVTSSSYIPLEAPANIERFYKIAEVDTFGEVGMLTSSTTSATALDVDAVSYSYIDLLFSPNPTTHTVSWGAFKAMRDSDGVTWNVSAGSATHSIGDLFLYYIPGQTLLRSTTSLTTAIGSGGRILAVYKGGAVVDNSEGGAFFSGDRVIAGTLTGSALVTDSAVITGSAQIENAIINIGHLKQATIDALSVANGIQSTNYSDTTNEGFRIDAPSGVIKTYGGLKIGTKNVGVGTPTSTFVPGTLTLNNGGSGAVLNNSIVKKTAATTAYDNQAYSIQSYVAECSVFFSFAQITGIVAAGLTTDPTSTTGRDSIDYAIVGEEAGVLKIYENGTLKGTYGTYSVDDMFEVRYSGTTVDYLKNGASIATTTVASGLTLFFDSSIYSQNAVIDQIKFGKYQTLTPDYGARMEITGEAIKVHDRNDNRRVQLGNLRV
jgi:hypothetical protein